MRKLPDLYLGETLKMIVGRIVVEQIERIVAWMKRTAVGHCLKIVGPCWTERSWSWIAAALAAVGPFAVAVGPFAVVVAAAASSGPVCLSCSCAVYVQTCV